MVQGWKTNWSERLHRQCLLDEELQRSIHVLDNIVQCSTIFRALHHVQYVYAWFTANL